MLPGGKLTAVACCSDLKSKQSWGANRSLYKHWTRLKMLAIIIIFIFIFIFIYLLFIYYLFIIYLLFIYYFYSADYFSTLGVITLIWCPSGQILLRSSFKKLGFGHWATISEVMLWVSQPGLVSSAWSQTSRRSCPSAHCSKELADMV